MNKQHIRLLQEIEQSKGLLRMFLHSDEITTCNQLVKFGYASKGKNDAKNGTTMFFITRAGELYLESL